MSGHLGLPHTVRPISHSICGLLSVTAQFGIPRALVFPFRYVLVVFTTGVVDSCGGVSATTLLCMVDSRGGVSATALLCTLLASATSVLWWHFSGG
jgi:hypothetical protein